MNQSRATAASQTSDRQNERALKAALLNVLRDQQMIDKSSCIANEFYLPSFSYRADLAILSKIFIGIEIKSELDSLRRLQEQTDGYLQYFDMVIVVLAEKHLAKAKELSLRDANILAVGPNGKITMVQCPKSQSLKRRPFWELMTQTEKRVFDRTINLISPTNLAAREALEREAFYAAFQARFTETSRAFWSATNRRKIAAQDLQLLSRYHELRESQAKWNADRAVASEQWLIKAQRCFA